MTPPTDFDAIAVQVKSLLASAKQKPVDDIQLDTPLDELQVDSLDKVSLAFDIEEAYSISIPESALAAVRTVRDIVTGIEAQLRKQAPPAETPTECA